MQVNLFKKTTSQSGLKCEVDSDESLNTAPDYRNWNGEMDCCIISMGQCKRRNSSVLAMELCLSCTNPSL